MILTSTEKQQIEAAVDAFLESPSVQATIANVISSGETQGVTFIDTVLNNAKFGGFLGAIFTALKGSAEAEIASLVASLPPAAVATMATNAIEAELKAILGA